MLICPSGKSVCLSENYCSEIIRDDSYQDDAYRLWTPKQRGTSAATAMTTSAKHPNNDALGERLRLYVEENFHNA